MFFWHKSENCFNLISWEREHTPCFPHDSCSLTIRTRQNVASLPSSWDKTPQGWILLAKEHLYKPFNIPLSSFSSLCTLPLFLLPFSSTHIYWVPIRDQLIQDLSREALCDFFILNSVLFPGGSDGKASACNVGDPGSIPGLGRSPGEGNGIPLQYSCLENSMDRGAW